jgi:PIN domain nuclease of toxin-antitoxin system
VVSGRQSELSATAKKYILADDAENFVNVASLWEIAIKISIGKLELKKSFKDLHKLTVENGFQILPITFEDTAIISSLPFHHTDPFDRILIAQSFSNQLTLVTKDKAFKAYVIKTTW